MFKAPINVIVKLPLIGDEGHLSRTWSNRIPVIPRVGETLFILEDLRPKVVSVEYMGNNYNIIVIKLEPISSSFLYELTDKRRSMKWKNAWTYYDSKGYPSL